MYQRQKNITVLVNIKTVVEKGRCYEKLSHKLIFIFLSLTGIAVTIISFKREKPKCINRTIT